MKYTLIGENDINNIQETFLHNRGITDVKQYCHLTSDCVNDYNNLENIQEAVRMYVDNMEAGKKMAILVDPDCDGMTSAAALYNYTKLAYPDADMRYYLHTSKQHGLSNDIVIENDVEFLCIPDASTNDTEQCKALKERGIDILILDHHLKEVDNPYAVIVNNQCSPLYSNKELSGVGIVWQFLRAVDEELWLENADNYLDLVAIGNIADIMDMRSYETKYLVEQGLKQIVNPALEAFIDGQRFQIKGRLNVHAIEWNISPIINAVCRAGTQEDKEILFKALIGDESSTYKAKKKNTETGKFDIIDEDIYNHAFRIAKNAKARQDKAVKAIIPQVKEWITNHDMMKFPVLFARLPDETDGSYTGLIANRIANELKKPTIALRKTKTQLAGSGRNFDNSPLASLKDLLDKSEQFNMVRGHDNAFGVGIDGKNVNSAIAYCSRACKGMDFTTKTIDFALDYEDFDIGFIREIDRLQDLFGTGLKEPLVLIKNIELLGSQGVLIGKDATTWKFIDDNDLAFIKFSNEESDPVLQFCQESLDDSSSMKINAICKVGFNEYQGVLTPQAQIIDYEEVN